MSLNLLNSAFSAKAALRSEAPIPVLTSEHGITHLVFINCKLLAKQGMYAVQLHSPGSSLRSNLRYKGFENKQPAPCRDILPPADDCSPRQAALSSPENHTALRKVAGGPQPPRRWTQTKRAALPAQTAWLEGAGEGSAAHCLQ